MPEVSDRINYGRFRNVYLYITNRCQLRCGHCYMGDRLDAAQTMPFEQVVSTMDTWRKMGGSKLTILGGEPTLHRDFVQIIHEANAIGFEHVILTTNGQRPAALKLAKLSPSDFAYVQVSMDGGTPESHDAVRGPGTFKVALETIAQLCESGFDTRLICTVNSVNRADCLNLLQIADDLGVKLVKFHVFSTIGVGQTNESWALEPAEWLDFCDELQRIGTGYSTIVSYQPTYARTSEMPRYAAEGYRGCIGRALDRISIFPDGRCYVCSYLFDTDLHYAQMTDGLVELNKGANEFDLFTKALHTSSCGDCKAPNSCVGGCPAEEIAMGASSCSTYADIVPVCRLWKSEVVGDRMVAVD